MSLLTDEVAEAVYAGKHRAIAEQVRQALAEGLAPHQILSEGLIAGMNRVGRDFRDGLRFIPEVMASAKAMNAALEVLRPHLAHNGGSGGGKVVLGTVQGDIHDVGKKLVGIMLAGAGFEVVDLGTDVTPEGFVQAVQREQPALVGLSALLTTTMPQMASTLEALRAAGVRGQVKVLVGGAPVTEAYAEAIEADAFAPDAATAVQKARHLLGLPV